MIDINLESLKHSPRTNLTKGKINNHDSALLIMAMEPGGIITSRKVKDTLRAWRGKSKLEFVYLWNTYTGNGNGFVGADISTAYNNITELFKRRTYWYRVKRGLYSITLEGYCRLGELQSVMYGEC